MAARRLLLLMLVLLAVSSLAAALVSPQSEREQGSETGTGRTDTAGSDRRKAPMGRLVREAIDAGDRRPGGIRLRRGDELALTVRSRAAVQVEIPAFGLLEDAARDDPARFDLLLDRRGRFDVRTLAPRRVIGRIVVAPPRDHERRRDS
ncbi:MAG: hypothetical protein ACRDL3_05845 [Solirubrobacterales bacterium]